MQRPSEILFVDPAVSDLETILKNLRPEVRAIVLDPRRPATGQIAAALEGHAGLDAIHVIAHGAAGRVSFASEEWSAGTLKHAAHDLAAIGRALATDGELRLWSCETASGHAGEVFVEALSKVTGAVVCASKSLVGAAALGGAWEISARASAFTPLPPLSSDGLLSYAAVLPTPGDLTLSGLITDTGSSKSVNTYYLVENGTVVGSFNLPSAQNGTVTAFATTITISDTTQTYQIYNQGFGLVETLSSSRRQYL